MDIGIAKFQEEESKGFSNYNKNKKRIDHEKFNKYANDDIEENSLFEIYLVKEKKEKKKKSIHESF